MSTERTRERIIAALTFLFPRDLVSRGQLYWGTYEELGQVLEGWWFQIPDDEHMFVGRDEFETLDMVRELVQDERCWGVVGPSGRRWEL